jgi:NAD+ diphosphatase
MQQSKLPPLARGVVDRDAGARVRPGREAAFDADPAARVIALREGRVLLAERVEGSQPALERLRPASLPPTSLRVYLGRAARGPAAHGRHAPTDAAGTDAPTHAPGTDAPCTDAAHGGSADGGAPIELRVFDAAAAAEIEPEAGRWANLRQAAAVLGEHDAALAAEALALAAWHEANPFCPRCGAPTEVIDGGWVRRCIAEERQLFPRTDPAVIVLVTDDDDRVLLGSNALWEQRRFSLLAGFVEPGEPLEHAVAREILEEAGLVVDRIEYVASQPWPMPASLMLGFRARLAPGVDPASATPDGDEIVELRWLSRDEVAAAHGEVGLPGRISIAAWLLEQWYGGPLPTDPPWPLS